MDQVERASCARHPELLSTFTCTRCGTFGCEDCRAPGTELCTACAAKVGVAVFDLGTTIADAFRLAGRALPIGAVLALVMTVVSVPQVFSERTPIKPGETPNIDVLFRNLIPALVGGCLTILLAPLVHGAFMALTTALAGDQPATLGSALTVAVRRYLPYLAQGFLIAIPVGLGALCCLLPGLWVYLMFSLGTAGLFVGGLGPVASLERSWELVKLRPWEILGGLIACAMPVLGSAFIFGVVTAVLIQASLPVRVALALATGFSSAVLVLPLYAFQVLAYLRLGGAREAPRA